ncbi:hypothetical protein HMPREF0762_00803 [Slackia exigua ATCC 700122]|uniref:Uncharacterized protein n=1 Tax=Slackia exigua (strain ATCC 700122 / DSM 15923 / CIP 105133 / JCM 11022 / KCTC 5966 / S-7) TaxID=649764 RepID=D0WG52_SLAES|nr:hypothetical protein HMPREF0762_00803 [Slackia exigua ATCC 700122]
MPIESKRILSLRAEAPLNACPRCGRAPAHSSQLPAHSSGESLVGLGAAASAAPIPASQKNAG